MNVRSELVQAQKQLVQNQTATMLELGTNLLNQTTAKTRKLTDVEAQVPAGEQVHLKGSSRAGGLTAQANCVALTSIPG